MRFALVVLTAFVLAGCGASSASTVRYLAQPSVSCPATAGADPARAEPLAADFVPVSAERCTFGLAIRQNGDWELRAVQRTRGPFDALLRALRSPTSTGHSRMCPDVAIAPTVLTLTDAAGHTVIPAIPAASCNRPQPAFQQALDQLPWTNV